MSLPPYEKDKGFIALVSVLLIGTLILAVVLGLSLRSIDESRASLQQEHASRALALATACAEDALQKLKNDLEYVGNESIIIQGESCDTLALGGSGNENRIVQTQSTVSNHTRKLHIQVAQVNPAMQISSWLQVADF